MSLLKQLWKNNLFKVFFITFVILIGSLIFLVFFHLAGVLTPNNFSAYISVVNNVIAITASLIALSIPFMMKDIESKKKEYSEKREMKIILKRLYEYLNLPVNPSEESRFPSFEMPYFSSLAKNKPELLIKLGIEVESRFDQRSGMTFSKLHILDKYRLYITTNGLKLEEVDFYGQYQDIYTQVGITDKIINEIKEKCHKDYKIKIPFEIDTQESTDNIENP